MFLRVISRYGGAGAKGQRRLISVGGWLFRGPWDNAIAKVAGRALSLNDIEHWVLRPIWRDPRVHYALNCASIGCPNLAGRAYTREHLERLLEQSARDYVNHPRGAAWQDGELRASSIYDWYQETSVGRRPGNWAISCAIPGRSWPSACGAMWGRSTMTTTGR